MLIERTYSDTESGTGVRGRFTFPNVQRFLAGTPSRFTGVLPGYELARSRRNTTFGFYLQDEVRLCVFSALIALPTAARCACLSARPLWVSSIADSRPARWPGVTTDCVLSKSSQKYLCMRSMSAAVRLLGIDSFNAA